ncbi:micronuclear linker histone polyprotein-like [Musca domestica]|uniref:Micronuclear linker histone polyprotein-like n=1 Tax=Musca domestica TaxID=7370 RepID=A0A1I8MVZ4_MUSDO|nr:micronuclear linker histone polyprotein-like [Musca domestica]
MASLSREDKKIYDRELRIERRRKEIIKRRGKNQHPALKKLQRKIIQTRVSSSSGKKSSSGSLKLRKIKKSVRLKSSSDPSPGENLPSLDRKIMKIAKISRKDKFVPFDLLIGKKSPVTLSSRNRGRKEPMPIGDSKRSSKISRKLRGNKRSSSSTITHSTRSSSEGKRRLTKSKRKSKEKAGGKRQSKTSSTSSSQGLLKSSKKFSKKPQLLGKQSPPRKTTVNVEEMRRQFKKSKGKHRQISFQRPLDKDTFKSIHLLGKNSDYFQMPRHSTSKPSYLGDEGEIPTENGSSKKQHSIYDDKYFRNLVKTQSRMIRDRIQKERKQKQHQMEQEKAMAIERARREKEERDRNQQKPRSPSVIEKELERLVQAGMKSQYKMTEVIPGETPVINEDILKMSEKGQRIDIRDLVPTSKIFEWPQPPLSQHSLPSTVSKSKRRGTSKKSLSKNRQKKRLTKLRTSQDSNESKEELNSEVKVSNFWQYQEPAREEYDLQGYLDGIIKEEAGEILTSIKKKRKPKRKVSFSGRKIIVNPEVERRKSHVLLVCQPCGMTYLSTEMPCCQLKSKQCGSE